MKTKDYTYNYKPVRILKRNAWEIAFCMMMGINVRDANKDELEGVIRGSMPASLESMQIWRLCDEKHSGDSPHMTPYMSSTKSDTRFSYAVIDVAFPGPRVKIEVESVIWMCETIKAEYESKKRKGEKIKIGKTTFSKKVLENLIENYNVNQESHNKLIEEKKKLSTEERDALKKKRDESLTKLREILKKKINDHVKEKKEQDGLRGFIYSKGFTADTKDGPRDYVVYKRSANKAKKGSCLFIWKELYDDMLSWTWLGLGISGKKIDLTSARAYEALVTSSITNRVKIDPESILLIDPVESNDVGGNLRILCDTKQGEGDNAVTGLQLLTQEEYEEKYRKPYENKNKIWDGQALVDESIFKEAGYKETEKNDNRHGMMLLRNSFFKACAFNTKIKKFYKGQGFTEDDTITDMFGNEIPALKVRMIVTHDSIKLFKFAEEFFGGDQKAAYEYWKKHISPVFGIVKEDVASHLGHGNYHEVSYQFLNSLPINDKEDIKQLLSKDREYMELLKNNSAVLMHRMRYIDSSMRKKFFIYTMFKYFEEFKDTGYFKNNYLKEELDNYNDKLKVGRLKLRGDFYTLCSMPYEMLEYTITNSIKPQLEPDEVYISDIEPGKEVTLIRYPHLASGSVCSLINTDNENYRKWFNFENKDGSNIVVVSPWNSNIMVKLGGADFDSDTALYVKDEVIEKAAKKLLEIEALSPEKDGLPVAVAGWGVKSDKTLKRKYTKSEMAKIDNVLMESGKTIGSISNIIQIFNSYLWEEYFKGKEADEDRLRAIYENILMLSVLNELTIDSAKHQLDFNPYDVAKEIATDTYNGEEIIETVTVKVKTKDGKVKERKFVLCPFFLYESIKRKNNGKLPNGYTKRDKGTAYDEAKEGEKKKQKNMEFWNCPMDLICEDLVKKNNTNSWVGTPLEDLLDKVLKKGSTKSFTNYSYKKARRTLIDSCEEIIKNDITPDEDGANDVEKDQRRYLPTYYSLKLSDDLRIRLLKDTYEKKTGKKKKGESDYKDPEMSKYEIRSRMWGFLFAPEKIGDDDPEAEDKPPTFLNISGYCRKDLITEEKYDKLDPLKKIAWKPIDLWGETWYYDSTLE